MIQVCFPAIMLILTAICGYDVGAKRFFTAATILFFEQTTGHHVADPKIGRKAQSPPEGARENDDSRKKLHKLCRNFEKRHTNCSILKK